MNCRKASEGWGVSARVLVRNLLVTKAALQLRTVQSTAFLSPDEVDVFSPEAMPYSSKWMLLVAYVLIFN